MSRAGVSQRLFFFALDLAAAALLERVAAAVRERLDALRRADADGREDLAFRAEAELLRDDAAALRVRRADAERVRTLAFPALRQAEVRRAFALLPLRASARPRLTVQPEER